MSSITSQILAALPEPVVTPMLRHAYATVVGAPLETFEFAQAPLSDPTLVFGSGLVYLLVIFGGQAVMRAFGVGQSLGPALKYPFVIHNFFLSFLSLVLFIGHLENVVPIVLRHGLFHALCHPAGFTKELAVLYYLNYLTKYYELIDTVFLVLKGKPLEFLHWYHHSLTMILCYTQLDGTPTVQWVPILLNLFVHVVMYYYYALSALKIRVWWKQYITTLQITQFVLDLAAIYYAAYYATYFHWRPLVPTPVADALGLPLEATKQCTGSLTAAYFGCALLTSYLLLFIRFFIKTYITKPAAAAKAPAAKGKGKGKGGKAKTE
ncbi:Fatty acyl-CoA elongase/Polyunsaturated fatty acid specific elongation enzyme [Blastocladiella emersonii ATCC 22665]|nr:Fatty acyl-CoA elongase/Polyunsaturated fatty acid specific elongation enzyme [Blastocladiella emersonii ATCC 22665]